jgi:CP family cyanate transporter-like MFS transporter
MRAVNRRTSPLILAGIVLMALNLRAAAASVGPMLPEIGRGLHLSHPQLALLTALPALAFACFSAIGPAMARTFGVHRAALLSLFAISIGLFARSLADEQWIFLALSTLALAGMAAAGVLLPSLVLLHFPDRLATLAAPYSRMLAIGFALAAVFTAPISHADGGWRSGLAFWGALALVAAIPWLRLIRHDLHLTPEPRTITLVEMVRTRTCQAMALLFGLQFLQMYVAMSWFPSLWRQHGFHATSAGVLLAVVALAALPFTLWLPSAITLRMRSGPLMAWVALSYPVADLLLLVAPRTMAIPAAVLLGVGTVLFPMSLALVGRHARARDAALSLAGVAQAVGYLMAGAGTFCFGMLHLHGGGWAWPLVALLVTALPLPLLASYLTKRTYVDDQLRARVAVTS